LLPLLFAWFAAAAFAGSLLYFLYAYLIVYGRAALDGATAGPVLFDVGLFTVFALHHSLFARTGLKRRLVTVIPARLERAVYTLIASALFVLVCWWWVPVPGRLYRLPQGWTWTAHLVLAAGVVVTLVSARRLDMLDLAGVRQVLAHHRPSPGARPALLTTGLYGWVRHPIYLGWVLLMAGVAEMTMTRFVFAAVSTLYLALAVPFEERGLIETFGPDYASYQTRVRWRMIPGIY
jgi:protein-S-isoprenylcysteine O-methyltransferase Ste14